MFPFSLQYIILGCFGGLLPDILRIIKSRYDESLLSYLKNPSFWLGVILLVALGGFAAWILGATQAKEALIFGYAAPEFFSKLGGKHQIPINRGLTKRKEFSLRSWWTI